MPAKPHNTASEVTAEEGEVHVDGPGATALAMTPEAAEKMAHRLYAGAREAHDQRTKPEGR